MSKFRKGDEVKRIDGYEFSTGEKTAVVESVNSTNHVTIELGGWIHEDQLELVKPDKFRKGDKVVRIDGKTFRNGEKVATVDHMTDSQLLVGKRLVYFKETGTHLTEDELRLYIEDTRTEEERVLDMIHDLERKREKAQIELDKLGIAIKALRELV